MLRYGYAQVFEKIVENKGVDLSELTPIQSIEKYREELFPEISGEPDQFCTTLSKVPRHFKDTN